MNQTAEIVNIEDEKQIAVLNSALTSYDIQEKVLKDLENSIGLEIVDTESEKVVRKFRQTAVTLRVKIEDRRKELNRNALAKNNGGAALIQDRLTPVETSHDAKIKDVEAEREEKRLARLKIETDRLERLDYDCNLLETACIRGLGYNIKADELFKYITILKEFDIAEETFQEKTEWAKIRLAKGIKETNAAYQDRVKFEEEQAEQVKIKAENDAAAKKLADEQAAFDAKQKAAKEAADKIAAQEAEKLRLANKKLEDDQKALDKEKADILAQRQADEAAKKAESERKKDVERHFNTGNEIVSKIIESGDVSAAYSYYDGVLSCFEIDPDIFKDRAGEFKTFLDSKIIEIRDFCIPFAIKENAEIDKAKKAKLKADKARAKLVAMDKKKIILFTDELDKLFSAIKYPELSPEFQQLNATLATALNTAILDYEEAGKGLV